MEFRRIAVIGDSHSRVFSNTPSFAPFFLGPGSDFNLVEYPTKISKATRSLLPKIEDKFDHVMLLFGEPSCRWQVDKDHYIHKRGKVFKDIDRVNENVLKRITEDYWDLISSLQPREKIIVCAPLSVYSPSLKFSGRFSENIKELCQNNNVKFIDPKNYFVDEKYQVIEKYKADPVHSSQEILPFIKKSLEEIGVPVNVEVGKIKGLVEIRDQFEFDQRFGCYKIKK